MKNKKTLISIICLLLIFVLSACTSGYNEAIVANWGISLPKGYRELFSTDSGKSFTGDGERYNVFGYKKALEYSDIEKFSLEKNPNIESEVEDIISSLKIPRKEKHDFSKKYYWYKKNSDSDPRNKLYMIYFVEDKKLYVIEDFY